MSYVAIPPPLFFSIYRPFKGTFQGCMFGRAWFWSGFPFLMIVIQSKALMVGGLVKRISAYCIKLDTHTSYTNVKLLEAAESLVIIA
jgi:hypothetical protein